MSHHARPLVAAGSQRARCGEAERQFPVFVVLGHGLLAATTLVLALLAAATA